MKIESNGPSLFNPRPWKSQLPRMGTVKVGGAGRRRGMQDKMEYPRMGGNVCQAAAWVFWGVRSKECFCFILVGVVLFKFHFDFGGGCFSPTYEDPQRLVLSQICVVLPMWPSGLLREVLRHASSPAPGIPSCLLVTAGETLAYGPVCVCLPFWYTSWGLPQSCTA